MVWEDWVLQKVSRQSNHLELDWIAPTVGQQDSETKATTHLPAPRPMDTGDHGTIGYPWEERTDYEIAEGINEMVNVVKIATLRMVVGWPDVRVFKSLQLRKTMARTHKQSWRSFKHTLSHDKTLNTKVSYPTQETKNQARWYNNTSKIYKRQQSYVNLSHSETGWFTTAW